jgi:hypothetical protein
MQMSKKQAPKWYILFAIWALQGALALWQFVSLPSDAQGGIIFGFSSSRLGGVALLLLWIILTLALAIYAKRRPVWRERQLDSIFTSRTGDILLILALLSAITCQVVLAILWGLARHGEIYRYAAYAARLAPIFNLVTLVGLELIVWIAFHRRQIFIAINAAGKDLFKRALIMWAALGLLAVFIAISGLGIVPDNTGDWGLPGVALLEWQILLACVLCGLMFFFEASRGVDKISRFDFWISVAIWLGTVLLWLSQPVNPGFSAIAPRDPNHEVYPFIDAQVYDEYAQSILIGNGLKGIEIPSRPLYVVFLAFLHLAAGQDYGRVIAAQSLILAFFPVGLYWIGKEFYGRPVGITMALLATLRDITSNIAAPFTYSLSYSKLYLSEIPVAIPIIFFILLGVRWAHRNYPNFPAFLAGGILGVAIMIRTQAGVALPVILFIAWLINRKAFFPILRGGIIMALGIVLVISPWIWRNWKNTGQFIFDQPATQTANLALRFSKLNGKDVDIGRAVGEGNTEYNDRLFKIFIEAVSANPMGAVEAVANRFLDNCVGNLLLLPLRNDLVNLNELWQPSRSFWEQWRAKPTPPQLMLIAFYLFLLGLGLAAAWKRLGLWAFAPLSINLLYNLWTSVALLSGQRFLLTMDWSIYMYYLIGIFVLIRGFSYLLEGAQPLVLKWVHSTSARETYPIQPARSWPHYVTAGLIFLLIGASIPISEKIFPKRYPAMTQEQLFSEFVSSPAFERTGLEAACLQKIITENNLIASSGRALSPRFYEAGKGEATAKLGYEVSDYSRLVFLVVGNRYGLLILNLAKAPDFFPHASDVVLFTDRETTYKAWFVLVKDGSRQEIYISEDLQAGKQCVNNS